jgi:uncharacterized protein (TIGR02453 family)
MKIILDFLKELTENNNREWFNAHKKDYETAKKEMENLVNKLIKGVSDFDNSVKGLHPKDCMFRIYRDVRFSADKSPYKTNFGSFITEGGFKSGNPGYYFHVQPGECFLSGGIYQPPADNLKKIRQEIYYNYPEFSSIVLNPEFKSHFSFWEDKLKRPPKDFDPNFEGIEFLKYKSYAPFMEMEESKLESPDIAEFAIETYKILFPFNTFLMNAISSE